jgi:RNA polymerase sigma-70 factor (ECF subfamily)
MTRAEEGGGMPADQTSAEHPGSVPELLARIRDGDEGAARELLIRYEPKVRLVVRRQLPRLLRARFDSLDFLQSVWGSFFHKIKTGPSDLLEEQNLIAFLAWAARNKVIDECRRAGTLKQDVHREKRIDPDAGLESPREPADSPSQIALARETYEHLRSLLPEERQIVLELKAAGYSCREIGDRLNVSERTVQRILEDLRNRARIED